MKRLGITLLIGLIAFAMALLEYGSIGSSWSVAGPGFYFAPMIGVGDKVRVTTAVLPVRTEPSLTEGISITVFRDDVLTIASNPGLGNNWVKVHVGQQTGWVPLRGLTQTWTLATQLGAESSGQESNQVDWPRLRIDLSALQIPSFQVAAVDLGTRYIIVVVFGVLMGYLLGRQLMRINRNLGCWWYFLTPSLIALIALGLARVMFPDTSFTPATAVAGVFGFVLSGLSCWWGIHQLAPYTAPIPLTSDESWFNEELAKILKREHHGGKYKQPDEY